MNNTTKKQSNNPIFSDDFCEERTLSMLFRQCKEGISIKIGLSNIHIPVDNENSHSSTNNLSTVVREFERLGKLFLALSHERKKIILYLGATAGFFHLNGIKKLCGYNNLTIQKDLKELQDYGLIKLLDAEEKSHLKKYRLALGMREYDFERADFFIINPDYRGFLENLPWGEIIEKEWIKGRIQQWAKKLRQTKHRIVKAQIESEKKKEIEEKANEFIAKLHSKFMEHIGDLYENYKEAWLRTRKILKTLYIKKLEGRNWRILAKKFDNDFFASCIEHEDLDIKLLKEVLEQVEKEGWNGYVRYGQN